MLVISGQHFGVMTVKQGHLKKKGGDEGTIVTRTCDMRLSLIVWGANSYKRLGHEIRFYGVGNQ